MYPTRTGGNQRSTIRRRFARFHWYLIRLESCARARAFIPAPLGLRRRVPGNPDGDRQAAEQAGAFDRSISKRAALDEAVPSIELRVFSMETRRCTKRPGAATAEPWPPWRRRSGPSARPCTRGISLDSRRFTSPAKTGTTKAAANYSWRGAIPTFKTT